MKTNESEKTMTSDEAIILANSKWYKEYSDVEIVAFQLYQPLLCLPFEIYHKAVTAALNCAVLTHELSDIEKLQQRFERIHPNADEL